MADALKAEGNKLFAAKKFPESMYELPRAAGLLLTTANMNTQREVHTGY